MSYKAQLDDHGHIIQYKDTDTGEVVSAKDFQTRIMMQQGQPIMAPGAQAGAQPGQLMQVPGYGMSPYAPQTAPSPYAGAQNPYAGAQNPYAPQAPQAAPSPYAGAQNPYAPQNPYAGGAPVAAPAPAPISAAPSSSLIQPGAQMLNGAAPPPPSAQAPAPAGGPMIAAAPGQAPSSDLPGQAPGADSAPTDPGMPSQGKSLRFPELTTPGHTDTSAQQGMRRTHGFLDATSIAILLPTLVLLALIIAAAHKKRLFPWQTIRTFNPPSGLMSPRDYEKSYICPPNLRRHGRMGKRNPQATWTEQDGIVIPFGFLARTHLPITIPLGRLPNKNMFLVAPSGSGKTTLMRAIIKALLAKPCVIIALEAKANDPQLDEKKEGFRYSLLPEAQAAGFDPLYFNPLDPQSIHWNPLDLDAITFASSIVQDINSLDAEEQHWAERDHGYISGLATLLKWGAVMVAGEDENGQAVETQPLPCNPRGLMRLVNNRRNIVESLRRCKQNPDVPAAELSELTQQLSSIIRTDTDWDKNIQGVRGRLRMFKNPNVLRCTEQSNIDLRASMHRPTVLIFGAPASLGPDAESLASCFVYQLQNALHTRYGTASVLPLFAFFDEYQTLNMDIAGRLSAIVRGANGGLAIILQNISQIAKVSNSPGSGGDSELRTIFSNAAIRVCLHNADETTAKFFSDEIGKHAIIVPGISDHYDSNGFGIFPTSWNRIHSQQVVARVDADSIKRMEKHHALVFMSPAGDPEFGELKPFMCDLRGIEEIARLHLLHNIAGSPTPEGDQSAAPGQPGSLPPGAAPGGPEQGLAPGIKISNPVLAAMMSPKAISDAAKPIGSLIGGISAAGANMAAQAMAAQAGAHSVGLAGPNTTPLGGAGGGPVTGGPQTGRFCTKCGKSPGKGRFCIECGNFVGQTAPAGGNGASMTVTGSIINNSSIGGPTGAPASPALSPPVLPAANLQQAASAPGYASVPSGNAYAAPQAAQRSGVASDPPGMNQAQPASAPAMDPYSRQPEIRQTAPNPVPGIPQAPQQPAGRSPLTNLHGDLSKFGVPQQTQQMPPRPTRPGSIEF
jgi:hypothetical protein